jgi:hypothetical protein
MLAREDKRPNCRIPVGVRNKHSRPIFSAEVSKLGDPGLVRTPEYSCAGL